MGNSPTPPGLLERIMQMVDERIARFAQSGFLRNATISEGGLTIKGGFLRLLSAVTGGVSTFYVGPVNPPLPDGSYQPGVIVRRNDGTIALILWDPIPDPGGPSGYNQFLGWYDRQGHAVFTDDTDSGLGIARPWLDHAFYLSRADDFPATTATSFETMWRAKVSKQQPRLHVEAWGVSNDAGAVGEIRVMVNAAQLGGVVTTTSAGVSFYAFDGAVAGEFGDTLNVEIQAQRTSGTGGIRVGAAWVQGRQS